MHFWIGKRSHGCGFNGRYRIPPSISGYGRNQRNLSTGFYEESMVTPVRRFQSIESVANNGLRYGRTSHSRPHPAAVHYNATNSIRIPQMERPPEMLRISSSNDAENATTRIRCIIQMLIASLIIAVFGTCLYYVYHRVDISLPTLQVVLMLIVISIVVMVVLLLYKTFALIIIQKTTAVPQVVRDTPTVIIDTQQGDPEDIPITQPLSPTPQNPEEVPPPAYHIAVNLAPRGTAESTPIIRDSPPPSYEKAT